MRKDPAIHRVVVLALDGVMPFELGIPGRVFGSALSPGGEPLYEVVTCSLDGGPVRTSLDFAIVADHGPEAIATAGTVVLPPQAPAGDDGCGLPPDPPAGLAEALATMRPDARLVSLCTAAFQLAAVGRLDGRPATTHWATSAAFRRRFPAVALDPDVLYVDDGDVLSAAGAAAGVDLCLHLVRRDHGSEVANQVARRCVVPPFRDGGQRQFVERPTPDALAATTGPARAWALEHLDRPLTLEQLAARAHISVRTFSRRFREEVGLSPHAWLTQQRVERARQLLETTDIPIEGVAALAGFGTATSLRQHFSRAVGVAPSAYRRSFRTEAAVAA
ncbi:MAG TPA: helix-turn-helix domain-containing protein [Capillimicrobium sp.]|nr:helix-turn-helix domain-containing protein [Capillimicrobium sp.]